MFTVRRTRAFTAGHYSWTIHVECQAPKLGADGLADGVDFNPFWRWIAEHVYGGIHDEQATPLWPHQDSGAPAWQDVGENMQADPVKWTAERFAFLLLTEFRNLSTAVRSVRVLRDQFDGRPYSMHDCTVTAHDAEPVTAAELVQAVRSVPQIVRSLLDDELHTRVLAVMADAQNADPRNWKA